MDERTPEPTPQRVPRWLVWGGSGAAGIAGLVWGYGFGAQLAGALLGVVTALNCAVICALLAGAALERLPLGRPGRR